MKPTFYYHIDAQTEDGDWITDIVSRTKSEKDVLKWIGYGSKKSKKHPYKAVRIRREYV